MAAEHHEERRNESFIWTMIRENFQSIGVGILIALGLMKPTQKGDAEQPKEREVPSWFMSAFPSLTKDDEIEYTFLLGSVDSETRNAAEEFEEMVSNDFWHDEVGYRVSLVLLRREFMERLKHPMPKDDAKRLIYEVIEVNDPARIFLERLREEKKKREEDLQANDEDGKKKILEEIYEKQKQIAIRSKVLPARHWIKIVMQDKLIVLIFIVAFCYGISAIRFILSRIAHFF